MTGALNMDARQYRAACSVIAESGWQGPSVRSSSAANEAIVTQLSHEFPNRPVSELRAFFDKFRAHCTELPGWAAIRKRIDYQGRKLAQIESQTQALVWYCNLQLQPNGALPPSIRREPIVARRLKPIVFEGVMKYASNAPLRARIEDPFCELDDRLVLW